MKRVNFLEDLNKKMELHVASSVHIGTCVDMTGTCVHRLGEGELVIRVPRIIIFISKHHIQKKRNKGKR